MCTFKDEQTVMVCDVAIGQVRERLQEAFGQAISVHHSRRERNAGPGCIHDRCCAVSDRDARSHCRFARGILVTDASVIEPEANVPKSWHIRSEMDNDVHSRRPSLRCFLSACMKKETRSTVMAPRFRHSDLVQPATLPRSMPLVPGYPPSSFKDIKRVGN